METDKNKNISQRHPRILTLYQPVPYLTNKRRRSGEKMVKGRKKKKILRSPFPISITYSSFGVCKPFLEFSSLFVFAWQSITIEYLSISNYW